MCNRNITYENRIFKKPDAIPIGSMEFHVFFTKSQFEVLVPMLITLSFFIAMSIFVAYLYNRRNKSGELKVQAGNKLNEEYTIIYMILKKLIFFFFYFQISKAEYGQSLAIPSIFGLSSFPQLQYVNEISHQSLDMVESADDAVLRSTELIEKRASGRFGAIWKARRRPSDETVAVKVFPLREKRSWRTELEVFQLPGMNHEDLLRFIGACRVGDNLAAEFWLLTDYCETGSLYDYLRNNTITGDELIDIALSIAR